MKKLALFGLILIILAAKKTANAQVVNPKKVFKPTPGDTVYSGIDFFPQTFYVCETKGDTMDIPATVKFIRIHGEVFNVVIRQKTTITFNPILLYSPEEQQLNMMLKGWQNRLNWYDSTVHFPTYGEIRQRDLFFSQPDSTIEHPKPKQREIRTIKYK